MLEPADCFQPLLSFNECITIQNNISLKQKYFYLKAASLGNTSVVLRLKNIFKGTHSFFTIDIFLCKGRHLLLQGYIDDCVISFMGPGIYA
jgi:hypothetical protein